MAEKNADNWLNMSKNLEKEISLENYKKFAKTTARLDKVELFEAYKNSLLLVMDLQSHLIEQYRVCQEFCVNRFNKQHRIAA